VYFAPIIIADRRGHHNTRAIFVLNLFAGWTVIAWVIRPGVGVHEGGPNMTGSNLLCRGDDDRRPVL
jgi:hypothetical protein